MDPELTEGAWYVLWSGEHLGVPQEELESGTTC